MQNKKVRNFFLIPLSEFKLITAPPNKFFKYYGGFGIDNRNLSGIIDSVLWFQNPTDFNDPFDCNPAISNRSFEYAYRLASRTVQNQNLVINEYGQFVRADGAGGNAPSEQEIVALAKHLMKEESVKDFADKVYAQYGVCCFSTDPANILMWSHYGRNHTGFVLEFDITEIVEAGIPSASPEDDQFDLVPSPVEYNENRPNADVSALTTKSTAWAYEQEVRILRNTGAGLYPYNRSLLKSAILGSRATEDSRRTLTQAIEYVSLKYKMPAIPIHQCFLHETEYRITIPTMADYS